MLYLDCFVLSILVVLVGFMCSPPPVLGVLLRGALLIVSAVSALLLGVLQM